MANPLVLLFQAFRFISCVIEVLCSTVIHMTYAVSLVSYALGSDLLRFLRSSRRRGMWPRETSSLMEIESRIASAPSANFSADVPPAYGEIYDSERKTKQSLNGRSPQNYHLAPIILLHGIFGFGQGRLGGFSYFGGVELKCDRILVPDLGSLSSLHDRVCELFYYLKGGIVDYGESHSHEFGHHRFGKLYIKGHFPEWNEKHPVHFVGHSSGVQVARLLQAMLARKEFPGYDNTNEDWIASITSISGAMNGTTRVYLDGLCPSDGTTIQSLSLLQVLRVGVLFLEWLDIPFVKKYYSWGFDHFELSWRKVGVQGLLRCLFGKSGPFHTGDWILPDLSIQSSVKLNKGLITYPKTYYFSYATTKTHQLWGKTLPSPLGIHPLFFLRSIQMCLWKHPRSSRPPYRGYRDEDWQDNDGALNTISMLFPRIPEEHPHSPLRADERERQRYRPGIWYYTILDADHIMFILDSSRAGVHFDVLYDTIFERCRYHLAQSEQKEQLAEYCCRNCLQVCICREGASPRSGA